MTRRLTPGSVEGPLRHPRQRRPHLAADAEQDEVALEPAQRVDDAVGRLAKQVLESINIANSRRHHAIPV